MAKLLEIRSDLQGQYASCRQRLSTSADGTSINYQIQQHLLPALDEVNREIRFISPKDAPPDATVPDSFVNVTLAPPRMPV